MKIANSKLVRIWMIITIIINCQLSIVNSQVVKPLAYGDMESWVVREIKESGIIGGNLKYLYALGPSDTIISNEPYTNRGGSPWATSNVLAKVAGITKTNTTVFPEERDGGKCARLETKMENLKVLGMINIEVLAGGSLYLGTTHEPISGAGDAQKMLDNNFAINDCPKAIRFDYKTKVMPNENRVKSTGTGRKTTVEGKDQIVVTLLLQKRWEDRDGRIFAKRVGTLVHRFAESTDGWVNGATFPILYGDITSSPEYKDYMRLQFDERYAFNSRGESVRVLESGWGGEDDTPTHIILEFASSHGGAYVGTPGNTFWVDNVALVY